jgi:hypothetical protein
MTTKRLLLDDLAEDRPQLVQRHGTRPGGLQRRTMGGEAEHAGHLHRRSLLLQLRDQRARRVVERIGEAVALRLVGGEGRGIVLPEAAADGEMRVALGLRLGEGIQRMQMRDADQPIDFGLQIVAHGRFPCTWPRRRGHHLSVRSPQPGVAVASAA